MVANAAHALALESAFHAFNEQSLLLETAYRELKGQVESLTVRLSAEQDARHRELLAKERLGERLRHLLETLPGALLVLDADGVVVEHNSNASALLNRPLTGRPWAGIVRREFATDVEGKVNGDLCLHDGRLLSLARRSLAPQAGEILLLTDVTESRRMAELLARHQRLSTIGEMTARLAHQIRTPLASAMLYASCLAGGDGEAASTGKKITGRLQELDGMIHDLLRFAAGARADDERVAVCGLLADVAEACQPQLAAGCRLSISLADDGLAVPANRQALQGALTNLVNNAAAACGPEGHIELGAVADADMLHLTVADNGPGIPAELRAHIFEPFFTTRPNGTGLGLAVVRSVAEAHGGSVLLQSDWRGTTVAVCLPGRDSVSPPRATAGVAA